MMTLNMARIALPFVALLGLVTTSLRAQSLDQDIVLGDSFRGLVHVTNDPFLTGDIDALRFQDLQGTKVSFTVEPVTEGFIPAVALFNEQTNRLEDLSAAISINNRNRVRVRNFVLPDTGNYQILMSGTLPSGQVSEYLFESSRSDASENKKFRADGTLVSGSTANVAFPGLQGAEVVIKATGRGGLDADILDLLDPLGGSLGRQNYEVRGSRAEISLVLPPLTGNYTVVVGTRNGTSGDYRLQVKQRAARSNELFVEKAYPTITASMDNGTETGIILIDFTLASIESGSYDILPEYSLDTVNFNPASSTGMGSGTTNLASTPTGVAHQFQWDSAADLPGYQFPVAFRMRVAGGGGDSWTPVAVNTAETFIPGSSTMNDARARHIASLDLGGRLLLAGGDGAASTTSELGSFAGNVNGVTFNATTGTMNEGRTAATIGWLSVANLRNTVIVGGEDGSGTPRQTAETYDTQLGLFASTMTNQARLGSATAALSTDRIATFGGTTSGDTGEEFDPVLNLWTSIPGTMSTSRTYASATLLQDGRVLIAGGTTMNGTACEIYDPATQLYSTTAALTVERRHHCATRLLDGRVLITGGLDASDQPVGSAEIFDPQGMGSFTLLGSLTPRAYHQATRTSKGRVILTGGQTDQANATALADVFRPSLDNFTAIGSMRSPRIHHRALALLDGRLVVTGGENEQGTALDTIEVRAPEGGFNQFPTVTAISGPPVTAGGNIPIDYTVVDAERDPVEIVVRWRSSSSQTWHHATAVNGADYAHRETSPTGTNHTFTWDSLADTGAGFSGNVIVQVTPISGVPGGTMQVTISVSN